MRRLVIGILAHVDAGKTTLSEAILYKTDKIRKLGRVDKKDAFLDNFTLERERGITIFSKQAIFERGNISFTLIDTPGHVDFSTEMERTLSVLDIAVLVISGTDGIQAHTRTLWRLLEHYDVPAFIFVNKMDREGCDRENLQKELESQLSDACVLVKETDVSDKKIICDGDFAERIAMCDEDVMERYLEDGKISPDDIRELIGERKLFPCFYGSALKLDGIDEFLDGLAALSPELPHEDRFGARVYKIGRDQDGNRLTYMKLTGGELKNRTVLEYTALRDENVLLRKSNEETDDSPSLLSFKEKVTQLRVYEGEKYETTETASRGMVVAALGLTATYAGQVIGEDDEESEARIVPVMTYRVIARDRSALTALLPKLKILEEEDPSLGVAWNDELKELQIRVMGDIQLEIIKRQLIDRFGEEVDFDKGSVLYKETVSAPVLGVGHFEPLRHYAEAQLLIEPSERGMGVTAESRIPVNELELNWQRLILTHIYERRHKGVLIGAELTDVNIAVVAGRAHLKHTEGGDFRQATYRAVRQGLMRAREEGKCVILEPYYELTIELPRVNCGRAMTDIEGRFGKITSQYEVGSLDMVGITGVAPVSTMQGYSREVSSYTKGLGSVYCSFFGYLPCHNTEEVVSLSAYSPESDLRNPSSSVFCAHGAGFVVEWNDVDSYKHLNFDMETGKIKEEKFTDPAAPINFVSHAGEEPSIGTEEIDAIISKTFHANKKDRTYRNPFRKYKAEKDKADGRTSRYYSATVNPGDNESGNEDVSFTKDKYLKKLNMDTRDRYLLVDGYNIIFKWPELSELAKESIDGARDRLNDILCDYQSQKGCRLMVVYDAYRVKGHQTEFFNYHNIIIVFTKEAETADKFIERFAHENAKQANISVATSDGLEQIIIRGAGCLLVTASDLLAEVNELRSATRSKIEGGPASKATTRLGDLL
ncbi:MAG: TetM/TetW/TetO/TetS family tetracycline resistance ribosomal protection protein [Lachnospiraceae bacterium]|nr:TetM/TetW/TetO/TetS family tetracycline resistance ribosomal protection protein [Lachnospiraceae bacterium]